MNTLSLRISANTSDCCNRNDEDLVEIEIINELPDDVKKNINIINLAATTEHQLKLVKELAKSVELSEEVCKRLVVKTLVVLYLNLKSKHPAKNSILSSLKQMKDADIVEECLSVEIRNRCDTLDYTSIDEIFAFISIINESTQNFALAVAAIGQNVELTVRFLQKAFEIYVEALKGANLSPSEKNELAFQLHCLLQATIFCIKTYTISNDSIKSHIQTIVGGCHKLLDHLDLPMDTKNNCAKLIVAQSKTNDDFNPLKLIVDEQCSDSKRLCVIFGVVNSLDSSLDVDMLLKITNIVNDIYKRKSVESQIILSVCRLILQITKRLASSVFEDITGINELLSTVMKLSFLNLEHYMDSVKHHARDTLKVVGEIGSKYENEMILEKIFMHIRLVSSINLKSIVVNSMCSVLEIEQILTKLPCFHQILISSINENLANDHNLVNCYESMACKIYNKLTFENWYNGWVMPIIAEIQTLNCSDEKRIVLENLMKTCIKKDKNVLHTIMKQREKFSIGFVLMSLATGKKLGYYDDLQSTEDMWKGILSFSQINNAMLDSDDALRVSAIQLIVESRKTTDGFVKAEFDSILFFLKYNINIQSPSMRQSILASLKNIFLRTKSSLQLMLKKRNGASMVEMYFEFLVSLQSFCVENLFDGANFSRRMLCLTALHYVVKLFNEFFMQQSTNLWNQKNFDTLINVIKTDSFEANKQMAIEIIRYLPILVVTEFNKITLEEVESMAISIRPPESLTASYLLELVTEFSHQFGNCCDKKSAIKPEIYSALIWCQKLLDEGLNRAEISLILASNKNPLYGLILCIRHLIEKLELSTIGSCQLWRELFASLIIMCKKLTNVVGPIVNNSSPEGILPSEDFDLKTESENNVEEWTLIASNTTPQMILLCAWRTVKEVSLLLGDISFRAPLISEKKDGLITAAQLIAIGDHFLELLSKTKHRGAFEQCYFGFAKVCLRLWTCQESQLHNLPTQMLNDMISSISGEKTDTHNELMQMENLCSTRRSAGLPFMIQALITAELRISSKKSFHFVMKSLIRFCRQGTDERFLETRTHSLNILRALFRCTDLNEAIAEYVADGIKCAILGYGADTWIERNSSTLLFSSLMVRIFGVQRTKDSEDLNIRNKMTGRIFFLRYPELYDFFLDQLNEAAELVKKQTINAKLHPLMLLLNRLYISALEGSESNLRLDKFIPVVISCSSCIELPTRILCAKFVATILQPEVVRSKILESIRIVKSDDSLGVNGVHGILLHILHLVKSIENAKDSDLLDILTDISGFGKKFNDQLIIFSTVLEIIIEICVKRWSVLDMNNGFLINMIDNSINFDESSLYGTPIVIKKVILLKLVKVHLGGSSRFLEDVLSIGNVYEVQAILNAILMILDPKYTNDMHNQEYDIHQNEIFVFKHLFNRQSNKRAILINQLKSSKTLKNNMLQLTKNDDYYHSAIKAYEILSMLNYEKDEYAFEEIHCLIQKAINRPDHLKSAILKYVNRCIQNEEDFKMNIDWAFLLDITTESSFVLKSTATDLVATLAASFHRIPSLVTMLQFSKCLLLMLMDDDYEIRERSSKIVKNLIGSDKSFIASYAQENFINYLMENLNNFDINQRMALILMIFMDNYSGSDNNLDSAIVEYKVFEKNEVNIFSETLIIKRLCIIAVKEKLKASRNLDENLTLITNALKSINKLEYISENYLKELLL